MRTPWTDFWISYWISTTSPPPNAGGTPATKPGTLEPHIHDADFPDRFTQAARYLGTIDDRKVQLEFLEWMLRYAYNAREEERESIDRGVDALNDENARRFAMTIAERLRQEGMAIGKINSIQKLLGKRFGAVPPSLKKRLESSPQELLDRFLDDILDFEDLKSAERWWDARDKTGNA